MLPALLHGKLSREQENMEDVLTSNVFGLLKYAPVNDGLLHFLSFARAIDGAQLDERLQPYVQAKDVTAAYDFWPFLAEAGCVACEPDVLIRLSADGQPDLLVLIEAKYGSGKSSIADDAIEPPNDQLAKQWDNLIIAARREGIRPILVYLTAGFGVPRDELRASIGDYQSSRPQDAESPALFWLSWRHLASAFRHAADGVLADLYLLARRFDLTYYAGIESIPHVGHVDWTFQHALFDWSVSAPPPASWRFVA